MSLTIGDAPKAIEAPPALSDVYDSLVATASSALLCSATASLAGSCFRVDWVSSSKLPSPRMLANCEQLAAATVAPCLSQFAALPPLDAIVRTQEPSHEDICEPGKKPQLEALLHANEQYDRYCDGIVAADSPVASNERACN